MVGPQVHVMTRSGVLVRSRRSHDIQGMKPHPISVAAALLFAACMTTACTADFQDEMPGRAGTSLPAQAQAPAGDRSIGQPASQTVGLKTFRQIQDEANAQPLESSRKPPARRSQNQDGQNQDGQNQNGQNQDGQTWQRMSQDQQQRQPPVRRGSSSPPPPPIAQQVPQGLPPVGSTEAQTDRFKRDLLSPEVDRLRTDDAMGRLDPLQQRELFRKEQDLRQYGTGPRGY